MVSSKPTSPRIPGKAELGLRVTMRIEDATGPRDLVGILLSPISIQKRDGSIVGFDPKMIRTWRIVISPSQRAGTGAPRTTRIRQLDDACALTWPAEESTWFGAWLLRTSKGGGFRANSALPTGSSPYGEPSMAVDEAVAYVQRHFHDRGLPAVVQVSLPIYGSLDDLLALRGWETALSIKVLVADASDVERLTPHHDFHIIVQNSPSTEWLALQPDEESAPSIMRYPSEFAHIFAESQLIAGGRIAYTEDWGVISCISVREKQHPKGAGQALVRALAASALAHGVSHLALEVDAEDTAQIVHYESLGFRFHHEYRHRREPLMAETRSVAG